MCVFVILFCRIHVPEWVFRWPIYLHLISLLLNLILLLRCSHFGAFLVSAIMVIYILDVLQIGLGFAGRFLYAGELQILLIKTSPKDACEEGHKTEAYIFHPINISSTRYYPYLAIVRT